MTPPADAGPWTPSNFTLSAVSSVTPIAIDENDNCTVDTSDGTWNCGGSSVPMAPPSVPITLSGAAGTATLWVMTSFTLETGNTLTISGTKPAIFYVSGAVLINDAVVVESGELSAGVGVGGAGGNSMGGTALTGGGGGSYCGLGGVGFPVPDGGPAAAAGVAYGGPTLIPLLGGSAGGATDYAGGSGGGALQITSGTSITIVAGGSILAGGNVDVNANYTTGVNGSAGGSGGAILLESSLGRDRRQRLGEFCGSGSDNQDYGNPATIAASPALGGGTGGGAGSYGSVLTGGPGTGGTGGIYAGGGGGGAGYIRINTSNGSIGGIITPDHRRRVRDDRRAVDAVTRARAPSPRTGERGTGAILRLSSFVATGGDAAGAACDGVARTARAPSPPWTASPPPRHSSSSSRPPSCGTRSSARRKTRPAKPKLLRYRGIPSLAELERDLGSGSVRLVACFHAAPSCCLT